MARIVEGCGKGCSEMSGICLMSAGIPVVDNGLAILNIVLGAKCWYLTYIHACT